MGALIAFIKESKVAVRYPGLGWFERLFSFPLYYLYIYIHSFILKTFLTMIDVSYLYCYIMPYI